MYYFNFPILLSSLSLQDSLSPSASYISAFHDHVMMVVFFVVSVSLYVLFFSISGKLYERLIVSNESLEFVWTLLPGIILAFLAIPSLQTLYLSDEVVSPCLTVKIIGHQWYWTYQVDGLSQVNFDSYMIPSSDLLEDSFRLLEVDNNLILPSQLEIRLIITSTDVIHSWTIPSFGVKVDAVPGRLNQLSIFSFFLGFAYGQCSEICGAFHSFMPICIEMTNYKNFMEWISKF